MTNEEFSREMDIIYENLNKGGAVGLDAYEKSVILTNAQEKLAMDLANKDLSLLPSLVRTASIAKGAVTPQIDSRAYNYPLPASVLKIVNELLVDTVNVVEYAVVPLDFIAYTLLRRKPYSYPPRRTAFRLINSGTNANEVDKSVEILVRGADATSKYNITYVIQPVPIIFTGVTETIRGKSSPSITNMLESLHPTILEYAVTLAEKYYFDKYGNQEQ